MKKKTIVLALILFSFVGISIITAQSTRALRTGFYVCISTDLSMNLRSDGTVTVYKGSRTSANWASGSYRISSDRGTLTISFSRVSGDLNSLRGMSYGYIIYDNESFGNNTEQWSYKGN